MGWMTIPDQKYFSIAVMHQTLQKLTYLIGIHTALHNHKMHISARGYRRHHIQSKAGASSLNNRSLFLQCPGGTRMKVRAHTGFILKVNNCAFSFSPFPYLWKNLIFPLLDKFRISLVGSIQWFLTTESELMQQATDRDFTEFDSKPSLNQFGNYRTGPKGKNKFKLPGILVTNRLEDPTDFGTCELLRPTTAIPGLQSMPATRAISGQPVVDASPCKSKGVNDFFRTLSCLYPLDCANPYFFHCLGTDFSSIKFFHANVYST